MQAWYGKISIEAMENFTSVQGDMMSADDLLFVHYPDCQQLSIWLPRPGSGYGNLILRDAVLGSVLEEWPVADKLSGSVKILWDTVSLRPGQYMAEIMKEGKCQHRFRFTKYQEGEMEKAKPAPAPVPEYEPGPIIYRDGAGNIIPDEDLEMRKKALQQMENMFSRKLHYTSSGRSGTVTYSEGNRSLILYYELGGGDCIAIIDIPPENTWESSTGFPLDRRNDIILFVAERACADQAPHGHYQIEPDAVLLLRN